MTLDDLLAPAPLLNRGEKRLPGYAYKLHHSNYAMDVPFSAKAEDIDENEMSIWIPFASGMRRDGVGDLLEISGIDTERHRMNPIVLFDHGKKYDLPVAMAEDPKTGEYCVVLDAINKTARGKAFFYQGKGGPSSLIDSGRAYDHALFCEQLFDLMAKRYVRAGSIGYQVVKADPMQANYSSGIPQGMHLQKVLMLEFSAVVLPANQDTTRKMLSMKRVCGKPMSPYLVKSLTDYAQKAQQRPNAREITTLKAGADAYNNRPGDIPSQRNTGIPDSKGRTDYGRGRPHEEIERLDPPTRKKLENKDLLGANYAQKAQRPHARRIQERKERDDEHNNNMKDNVGAALGESHSMGMLTGDEYRPHTTIDKLDPPERGMSSDTDFNEWVDQGAALERLERENKKDLLGANYAQKAQRRTKTEDEYDDLHETSRDDSSYSTNTRGTGGKFTTRRKREDYSHKKSLGEIRHKYLMKAHPKEDDHSIERREQKRTAKENRRNRFPGPASSNKPHVQQNREATSSRREIIKKEAREQRERDDIVKAHELKRALENPPPPPEGISQERMDEIRRAKALIAENQRQAKLLDTINSQLKGFLDGSVASKGNSESSCACSKAMESYGDQEEKKLKGPRRKEEGASRKYQLMREGNRIGKTNHSKEEIEAARSAADLARKRADFHMFGKQPGRAFDIDHPDALNWGHEKQNLLRETYAPNESRRVNRHRLKNEEAPYRPVRKRPEEGEEWKEKSLDMEVKAGLRRLQRLHERAIKRRLLAEDNDSPEIQKAEASDPYRREVRGQALPVGGGPGYPPAVHARHDMQEERGENITPEKKQELQNKVEEARSNYDRRERQGNRRPHTLFSAEIDRAVTSGHSITHSRVSRNHLAGGYLDREPINADNITHGEVLRSARKRRKFPKPFAFIPNNRTPHGATVQAPGTQPNPPGTREQVRSSPQLHGTPTPPRGTGGNKGRHRTKSLVQENLRQTKAISAINDQLAKLLETPLIRILPNG